MTPPRITVAMSVYNNAPYLAEALDSILAQSFGDFELVIVDDGSTDASPAIMDHYAAIDPRVRVIRQANQGLIASLNHIIAVARGMYIARMDGDDVALPERFAQQVAFLDANPDHGLVGTQIWTIDEQGDRQSDRRIDHPLSAELIAAALPTASPLCHPSVMMRRELLIAVGRYRAAYRHCEDYDLWLRLAERTRMANLPARLHLYRYSPTQVSNRHVLAQRYGVAVARLARLERAAGRRDPSEDWTALPPIEALDTVFGRPGVTRDVRAEVVGGLLYAPDILAGEGLPWIAAHLDDMHREGRAPIRGLWRAVARLARHDQRLGAWRLASLLIRHGVRR
jgi:GT2 family glycosyltransferase